MTRYLAQRIVFAFITLLAATAVIFILSRSAGDPRYLYAGSENFNFTEEQWDQMGRELGLDKPLIVQYVLYAADVARGDFGKSLVGRREVTDIIMEKLPATLKLGAVAWITATLIGVPLGIVSAVWRGSIWDYIGRAIAVFGQALPSFWVGIVAILIFSVQLGWLPSLGRAERWEEYVLPAGTLALLPLAGYLRLTRSSMLAVLDSDYIVLARSKGVSRSSVILKHAFRNAVIPPLTFSGLLLLGFITGTTVVEVVFSWPGLGRLAIQAVRTNDFSIMAGIMLLTTALYVTVNIIVDLLYVVVDPRIRLQ
ncbi:MAG: ABC transporter permease [Chloroflexota bacterium]